MMSAGVGNVAAVHAAQDDDKTLDAGPGDEPASSTSERLDRRQVIADAAKRSQMQGVWKYQVAVYDFYHDVGRKQSYVQVSVALLIFTNFICQVIQRQVDPAYTHSDDMSNKTTWVTIDTIFNVLFLIELLINMYGSWMWPFLSQGWNLFDLFVVSIGVIDLLSLMFDFSYPPQLKTLRLFRAFRVFRLFGRVESLRKILDTIWKAVPGVINAFILLLIVMSIYSVLAVDAFGGLYQEACALPNPPPGALTGRQECYGAEYYGCFTAALYTLFQILTGESWPAFAPSSTTSRSRTPNAEDNRGDMSTFGVSVFFVSFILINSFVILNVVVAVLLDGMSSSDPPPADDAGEAASPGGAEAEPAAKRGDPRPKYAKDLENSMQELNKEVADLKSKIDTLLQSPPSCAACGIAFKLIALHLVKGEQHPPEHSQNKDDIKNTQDRGTAEPRAGSVAQRPRTDEARDAHGVGDYFSAKWYGYLLPKASGIHNLRIEADSGVRLLVGESWVVDELGSSIAVGASAQVSLTEHEPIRVQIEYVHQASASYVRLYWSSTAFEEHGGYLLYPLNVLGAGHTTTLVSPDEAAEYSTTSGDAVSTSTSGLENVFVLHTRDAYDNARATDTTASLSGYIDSVPPVYLEFAHWTGGDYYVTVVPNATGTYNMYVLVDGEDLISWAPPSRTQ
ncbi:unnamed protein product [Prorocentrum cordatum]|uniref:PA14 domain-containing protein n=1 Tax=Prorocentrum cordatum TaxID=2364126 RepID=A0ABN9TCL5_9DINO|nr:unnamed protein product [Polarella glacialis]